jgi:hypothetical protein
LDDVGRIKLSSRDINKNAQEKYIYIYVYRCCSISAQTSTIIKQWSCIQCNDSSYRLRRYCQPILGPLYTIQEKYTQIRTVLLEQLLPSIWRLSSMDRIEKVPTLDRHYMLQLA